MIIREAELRVALNLSPTITEAQTARLMLASQGGHSAVRKRLRYDPEQRVGPAEFYPRVTVAEDAAYGDWELNGVRTRATFESRRNLHRSLQLARIPVRSVSSVLVDPAARHGQQGGDFGTGTAWSAGTDYHVEWDMDGFCGSGCLLAVGAWPTNLGTIKVTYRAGYSQTEFDGQATSSSVDATTGEITTAGIDASPIKAACLIACMMAYHELHNFGQSTLTGLLIPGPKQSETMGSYSYSLASGAAAAILAGMMLEIPPKAAQLLEPFEHYGVMAL